MTPEATTNADATLTSAGVVVGRLSLNDFFENEQQADAERAAIQAVEQQQERQQEQDTPAIVLRHAADIVAEQREAQWLDGLHKVLERDVLAVLAGARNTFKSFVALHWTMLTALELRRPANGEPQSRSVLMLSAEGAGLDRRIAAWMKTHAPRVDLRSLPLYALERPISLNLASTLEELHHAIAAQTLNPALIVIDTYSKYAPGLDENDNSEVALYLAMLTMQLRIYYRCTVLLVAHAGHADAKRPRGASVLMANPDAEYIVQRPDPTAMAATVTRERFKDSPSMAPLAYAAEVVDLGRLDRHGDPVTSLVMRSMDASAVVAAARPELRSRAQRQLLAALRAQANGSTVWTVAEIREIGRKAGINRNTARDATEALIFTPYLVPAVGGWRLGQ